MSRQSITDEEARELLLNAKVTILDMTEGAFRFQLEDGREVLCEMYANTSEDVTALWTLDG